MTTSEHTTPFDPAEYLDDDAVIAEYLTQVLEEGDNDELLEAVSNVARARDMGEIDSRSGLGRESLYKTLRSGANPKFDTTARVLRALDVHLTVAPKRRENGQSSPRQPHGRSGIRRCFGEANQRTRRPNDSAMTALASMPDSWRTCVKTC